MSLHWALEVTLVSCVIFSNVDAGSYCGQNRMFACVPTRFCSETRGIPSNYNKHCFSFETCCDLNKIIFGKRYSGGQFLPGPYDQSVYTSELPNNTGGKTSTTIGEKSVVVNSNNRDNARKTATTYNPGQTASQKVQIFTTVQIFY
ncbi:uncharacterized protein LOC128261427 isoform X1 [Drosophila gunungcola]|uniref:Uncharacterized protein n=1 Tax=Drosophila gunungcola TaxID=103775 RepID=A0A9P9YTJ4_9MUSC|nr:uncharacterized protein LOC128261427 isoform X1 [Drosophila gunungcola]KAI8042660.1 hypothetical protein M5D96_003977 [Drosophila gunungcola]